MAPAFCFDTLSLMRRLTSPPQIVALPSEPFAYLEDYLASTLKFSPPAA